MRRLPLSLDALRGGGDALFAELAGYLAPAGRGLDEIDGDEAFRLGVMLARDDHPGVATWLLDWLEQARTAAALEAVSWILAGLWATATPQDLDDAERVLAARSSLAVTADAEYASALALAFAVGTTPEPSDLRGRVVQLVDAIHRPAESRVALVNALAYRRATRGGEG